MKSFFSKIGDSIRKFMYGRHGEDILSKHLMVLGFLLWIISLFVFPIPLIICCLIVWGYSIFRTLSKNNEKRNKELNWYMSIINRIKKYFRVQKNKFRDRKTHKYFKCKCGTVLRVPKGKGKIVIHCPNCKKDLQKKT